MESTEALVTLNELPIGARLLVRSKKDWRFAVICRISEEHITLSVASPRGGCYRIRKTASTEIAYDGLIPFLKFEPDEDWRSNFSSYDVRW